MTDERITDYRLQEECERLAQDIFAEMLDNMSNEDAIACDFPDDWTVRAHEVADGHQWVIYYHYAHQIAGGCNAELGEQFLEDIGMPETPTYDSLATIIAYGEMRGRIEQALQEIMDAFEPADEGAV